MQEDKKHANHLVTYLTLIQLLFLGYWRFDTTHIQLNHLLLHVMFNMFQITGEFLFK